MEFAMKLSRSDLRMSPSRQMNTVSQASWLSITALSEMSIATGSAPVAIPDFTDGEWIHRHGEADGRYALD